MIEFFDSEFQKFLFLNLLFTTRLGTVETDDFLTFYGVSTNECFLPNYKDQEGPVLPNFFTTKPVYFEKNGGFFFVKFNSKNGDLWFGCENKSYDHDESWNVDWKLVDQKEKNNLMKIAKKGKFENFTICASVYNEIDFVKIVDSKHEN